MSHDHDIFLDHAATTPVHPQVLGLMLPFFGNHFATPSSPFSAGEKPRTALAEARARVASLIGAQPAEIIFTSSGTEANNLALQGIVRVRRGHVIVSAVEHASVMNTADHLKDLGCEVTVLPVDSGGMVDPARIEDSIRKDTALISVMHASNETGTIQPVEEIGRIAGGRGIAFHCDCVQSAGKIPVDVNGMHADLLSISSHKLYGPKGAGALYVREGTRIAPVLFGSPGENGLRPGHLNMPAIVAFGMACEEASSGLDGNAGLMQRLRDLLEQEIRGRIPGVTINGAECPRVPHITSISFDGILCDALTAWLDLDGITASPRASLFSRRPSYALEALGLPAGMTFGTVRFSPGWENTEDQIRRVVDAVEQAVTRLRGFSRHIGDDMACIITFTSKNHIERSVEYLEQANIPCAVTARPLELAHLGGPRIALAVPCERRDEAIRSLGTHKITPTGMHHLKGLCRKHSGKEERFWEKVASIKGDDHGTGTGRKS